MFRLSFWRSCGLRLEDRTAAEVVMTAYLAGRFDVLARVVSEQPAHEASRPVEEQSRFRADVVADRLAALAAVARTAPHGWRENAFGYLLPPLYVDAVGGGKTYFQALQRGVAVLAGGLDPARVPVAARVGAWAVLHGTLEDDARVQDFVADNPHGLPVTDGIVALPDGLSAEPPREWRAITDTDRRVRSWMADGVIPADASVVVRGATFTEYVDDHSLPSVSALGPDDTRVPLAVTRTVDPRVNEWAGRAWEDRSSAAWVASVHAGPLTRPGRHDVEVTYAGHELRHTVVVADPPGPDGTRIDSATLSDGRLDLAGRTSEGSLRGRFCGPSGTVEVVVDLDGERLTASVDLAVPAFGARVGLPRGRYTLELRNRLGERCAAGWTADLVADPPELVDSRHRVVLVTGGDGPTFHLRPPLRAHERGAFGQQELQSRVYAAPSTASYDSTVLLETFRGRSIGDHPGAIARELLVRDAGVDLVWVVDDPGIEVPDGTRAVTRRSQEWYDALANARIHVSNAGAPYWFAKKSGQVHLQTWHGTPLKKIGEDRGPGDFATWRHRRRIAGQAAGWDALVSPSRYCSTIFRSAFRYDGRMLEVGSPRNDILLTDTGALRRRTRERLGLTDGDRVVLYAPTWREYVGVRDSKPLYLDAERLTAALADTVVLIRGHYNSTGQSAVFADHPRILDVTRYPDIADLYLAADVLVTDYSSVMFDFVLTDKPIVLLVPDLDRYRDVERGFYFDIESRPPGPMVGTTDAVAEALSRDDDHAEVRAVFRRTFCPHDDGAASARVVDWLLSRS
jgi:CDP-glycerol glycerophosphotransferase